MDSEDETTYDNQSILNASNLHRSFDSVLYENDEVCGVPGISNQNLVFDQSFTIDFNSYSF